MRSLGRLFLLAALPAVLVTAPSGVLAESADPLPIGVIASLSAKGAARGNAARLGIELARAEIAKRLPELASRIQLVYEDVPIDQPAQGVNALGKLAEHSGVCLIVGPMGSPVASAVAPVAEKKRIPVIVHTASASEITRNRSFVFRIWPIAADYPRPMVDEITRRNWRTIAILSAQHENTADLSRELRAGLPASVAVTDEATVSPKETDFKSVLTKLAADRPDAIFLNLFEGQIGIAARQARELNIPAPFFSNAVLSSVEVKHAQGALEGTWFPRFAVLEEKNFGESIDALAAPDSASAAHDALLVAAEALSRAGCDRDRIARELAAGEFSGAAGRFRFNSGNASIPIELAQVQLGTFQRLPGTKTP